MRYEMVVGLEVHIELSTESKMFCDCSAKFGGEANTHVCPVCLGMPGVLPVPNKKAIDYAMRASLALNCQIAPFTKFDRKNYHYPDMPKDYQISQYDKPIGSNGYVVIRTDKGDRRIGIRRLHMEEDTGKSLHEGVAAGSLLDFNRAGVPLIEIVSEPDIRTAEEARLYLQKIRTIMLYTGVSDVKMEEGSMRCDANISLRPEGSSEFGTLVEIKNMNSFRSVQRALEYEAARQQSVLESGGRIVRETRHWDEGRGVTFSSRSKEEAHDYRYFPDPDLVPLEINQEWVDEVRRALPELPDQRFRRYVEEYNLPAYDARVLVEDLALAGFFDEAVAAGANPKAASNWIMVDLQGLLKGEGKSISEVKIKPSHLTQLIDLIEKATISGKIAKDVLVEVCFTGKDPESVVKEKGLVQITDESALIKAAEEVLAANPGPVEDYRKGKKNAIGFLVGQLMKATRGKANPGLANDILRKLLDGSV